MKKKYVPYLSIALLLLIWQVTAMIVNQPLFFPSIDRLAVSIWHLLSTPSFYMSLGATIGRGVIGMLLSFGAAAGFAFVFTRVEWLQELFRPLLAIMRSIPVISFILLALIFLHAESIPLLIGFLTMFPLLTENLTKGISQMRPEWKVFSHQFRLNRRNHFTQIIYPQIKPFLYSGLASAAGFGWRAIIMGEVLSQCNYGIGSEMKQAQVFISVPELIAWTVIAIGLSFLTDRLISRANSYHPPILFLSRKKEMRDPLIDNRPKGLPVLLDQISYHFGIHNFSYTFEAGKKYAISAPSGAGKTTLLKLINGTLTPTTGTITIDRRQGIASLFQEPELLPHLSALDNIALPLARLASQEIAYEKARELLHLTEMEEFESQRPTELSYGQQQRVALARALIYPSPFLFLDEPFKGLDESLTQRIIERIVEKEGLWQQTLLFTSHNPEEVAQLSDTAIYL